MTQLILYTSEDGESRVQLRADRGTVWLSQLEMAELFLTTKQNIAKHLKAIFTENELSEESVVNQWLTTAEESSVVQTEGGRENVVQILAANGFPLLTGAGSVSHTSMERQITPLFLEYEQRRTSREAQAADAQDEAELKALENRIKDRKGAGA
jgi:hypothetical protein